MNEPLLTARQLADLLGIPIGTVRTWTAQGRLPSVKVYGRLVRYRLSAVQEGLEVRPVLPRSRSVELERRGALSPHEGQP